ncbi:hypothetical protein C4D60_Mb00t02760 [Musa balbisiana]|uniref:NADH:quinone oxidoreductase/Mrp antiporter transmembrane domain-containing protein n=1 Tax=Musa balbisiana TaxID=52838 RepID=A0A4S8I654_MUSBA|nr:hypothetical protein C4D60_Mb00t02760 [Musa balbisiana]
MAITEFLLFVLTATLGGMFLCGANDLITIFVAPECFSLCSYLLSGYTKRDVRSNEATMKYLLMGGASSSILVHGFSWLYGSSGGEIELQEIVNGIGFKLSPAPFHQWTPDVYEGVRSRMFQLCSYLLSGYTKRDVRSNEATMKYLLMGGASSSILVHGFSWLYGSSGGEIELQEIVNGLINTQMYNSPGISIALISITVGIGFKLSPAPFHQWTPDVYEGVRFVRQIPTSISISEMFGFFKTP